MFVLQLSSLNCPLWYCELKQFCHLEAALCSLTEVTELKSRALTGKTQLLIPSSVVSLPWCKCKAVLNRLASWVAKLLSLLKKIRAVNQVMFYNQVQQFLHNPLQTLLKFVSDILLGSSIDTGVYHSWFNYILFDVLELSLLPWSSTTCLSHFFLWEIKQRCYEQDSKLSKMRSVAGVW